MPLTTDSGKSLPTLEDVKALLDDHDEGLLTRDETMGAITRAILQNIVDALGRGEAFSLCTSWCASGPPGNATTLDARIEYDDQTLRITRSV